MTGICPTCGKQYRVPSTRGSRVGDRHCPVDGTALVGPRALACSVRGRYAYRAFDGSSRFQTGDCGEPRGHVGSCRTSSGHVVLAAPADMLTPRPRDDGGYDVFARDVLIGTVMPFYPPSHIRVGRAQANPWWAARTTDGSDEGAHRRRVDALSALAWAVRGRPA